LSKYLNPQESEWREALGDFSIDLSEEYEQRIEKLEIARSLAQSLIARNAIPLIRVNYFVKPEYNLGNPRSSKKDGFERKGVTGEAIPKHPHFLPYLKYFIYGAELPEPLKQGFYSIKLDSFDDDDFIEKAWPKMKAYLTANRHLDRNTIAEEIFKLCLDLEVDLTYAKRLRNKIIYK
jgi:hypothetical protein